MRTQIILAVALLVGCGTDQRPWRLVLDGAQLAAPHDASFPSCSGAVLPDAFALVKVAGVRRATPPAATTLAPVWHADVAEADVGDYRGGIAIGVFAGCNGMAALAGSIRLRPSRSVVEGGSIHVPAFGRVAGLDLHFVALADPSGTWVVAGNDPYVDDGTWDDGTWDDGTWDDGTTGDPGDSVDDGSGDDGSDDGSEVLHRGNLPRARPRAGTR